MEKLNTLMKMTFNKVTIIGVGLIGGSLALSLKKHALVEEIWGWGRSAERLKKATGRNIIDRATTSLEDAVRDADLVVLATPVSTFERLAHEMKESLKEGSVVTDVGSVKGNLVSKLEGIVSGKGRFVGAHPIAGSDQSGIEHARADLFEGSTVVITETEHTESSALNAVEYMWRALGSKVIITSPQQHDLMLALISHLPHVVAYALVNTADAFDSGFILHSGGGFKDTTRIALSSEELWADICLYNREAVLKSIDAFQEQLNEIKAAISDEDRTTLINIFSKARTSRRRLQNG